jgi:activator of HSP90 ATPase
MKTYHKYYKIKATPDEVYNALVKPFAIALWTGAPAEMTEQPGTEFSLFGGDITGINIEFVPDEKIVQEWYFGDQEEKSIVTIRLTADNQNTNVELNHTNIPDSDYDSMKEGWDNYYFGGLREFFQIK